MLCWERRLVSVVAKVCKLKMLFLLIELFNALFLITGATPGRFTPAGFTPGPAALQTPLRDKLNINADDAISDGR